MAKKSILILENDPQSVHMIHQTISGVFEPIYTAQTCIEGINIVRNKSPDIVLASTHIDKNGCSAIIDYIIKHDLNCQLFLMADDPESLKDNFLLKITNIIIFRTPISKDDLLKISLSSK